MDMHEHFETLCGLAVTGQIAGRELLELTEHCETCSSCRLCIADFAEVSGSLLLGRASHGEARVPSGMYERFATRMQRKGIAMRPSPGSELSPSMCSSAIAALVCFVLLPALFLHSRSSTEDQKPLPVAHQREMSQSIASEVTSAVATAGTRRTQDISKHARGRRKRSPSIANGLQVRASYLNVGSLMPTTGLRFYLPPAQSLGYSNVGAHRSLSFSTVRSEDFSRPSLDRVAQPVFRFNPQLVHLAYSSSPSDFPPTALPPLRFQIPTAQ